MNIREALQRYGEALADPKMGIPCQEFQSGIRVFTGGYMYIQDMECYRYVASFLGMHTDNAGADAVNWFIHNMEGVTSREQAQQVGQRLTDLGIISEIQGTCTSRHA